jgi:hypothetical protein
MTWHPIELLRLIFVVLVSGVVIVGLTTRARPRGRLEWTIIWVLFVFLAWALLGFGWLRSR